MSREQKQFVDHRARLFVLARASPFRGGDRRRGELELVRSSPPLARQPEETARPGPEVSARFFSRVAEEKN
jgi:hypothetical protein